MFFKKFFQKRALAKLDTSRDVVFMPVFDAKKVTIIYNLVEEGIGDAVDFLIDFLEDKEIPYESIAINLSKNETDTASLKEGVILVNRKSINSYGLPENIDLPFDGDCTDLLIDFAATYNFTEDYIVKICKSKFKTGRCNYENSPFDFIVGSGGGTPLDFAKHTINYLSSIKPL